MPEKRYDRVRLPPRAEPVRRSRDRVRESARADTRSPGNGGLRALLLRLERGVVHRAGRGDAFAAAPEVEQALERRRGSGQPLPGRAREQMESAFGASFDDVTIHTGGEADALTRQVDAVAFTHGSDIYFSDGAYAPETSHGQRLLAHELTHVVQQHSARKVTVGAAYDPAESEADAVADAVVQRLQAAEPATPVAPATVARQAQPEEDEEKAQRLQRQPEDEEDEAQRLQRRPEDEEDEAQRLQRQPEDEEDERVQRLRRQEEEDRLVQPLRRSTPVTVESAPATTSAEAPTMAGEQPREADLFGQAVQAYRAGDLRRAQELFQQVRDDPDASERERANATWNVGRIHQELGDDRAALECYRAFLAMPGATEERRAVAERIVARMEREQSEGAEPVAAEGQAAPSAAAPEAAEAAGPAPERAARGAAIDDPRARANAIYREGVRAYRAGDLRRALELFQQVLDIDQAVEGHRASAIWNIGRIHQDMGNDRAALTMYRTYLAQPSVPDERRTVAQRIVTDLERELGPGGAPTPEATPEEGGAGKEPPTESLPTMPEQRAQALYGLASQAYQSGDFATALEHFQQLMRTDGLEQRLYTETLYNMGQCYRRMGNNGAAIDMFRGFLQQPDATPEERQRAQQLIAMLQH